MVMRQEFQKALCNTKYTLATFQRQCQVGCCGVRIHELCQQSAVAQPAKPSVPQDGHLVDVRDVLSFLSVSGLELGNEVVVMARITSIEIVQELRD